MAYLVPYELALKPDEEARFRAYILQATADIPDDTYQLQEWYCPNPDCACQEVRLQVLAFTSKRFVASFWISLDPAKLPDPKLDPSDDTVSYALALRQQIAEDLKSDPAYVFRLRSHYNQVKAVAADPHHPAYPELIRWGNEGAPKPSPAKRKRKRHA
jgi:hypothetical protein